MKQVLALLAAAALAEQTWAQQTQSLALRGHEQRLHLYGPPSGDPVIVTSGDGGWVHLAPHIASVLSARGFHVVGFDAKAYLTSFTTGRTTLDPTLEADDYAALAQLAAQDTEREQKQRQPDGCRQAALQPVSHCAHFGACCLIQSSASRSRASNSCVLLLKR